jgi:hypothetical protein
MPSHDRIESPPSKMLRGVEPWPIIRAREYAGRSPIGHQLPSCDGNCEPPTHPAATRPSTMSGRAVSARTLHAVERPCGRAGSADAVARVCGVSASASFERWREVTLDLFELYRRRLQFAGLNTGALEPARPAGRNQFVELGIPDRPWRRRACDNLSASGMRRRLRGRAPACRVGTMWEHFRTRRSQRT